MTRHDIHLDPLTDGLLSLAHCICGQTVGSVQPHTDRYHLTNLQRPLRPLTQPTTVVYSEQRAIAWFLHQHLFAWIRQPEEAMTSANHLVKSSKLDHVDQPTLPRDVLAEHAAAAILAALIRDITEAAQATTGNSRFRRGRDAQLSRIQILSAISQATGDLARSQARKAAAERTPQTEIAAALGVTKQRVNQIVRDVLGG